MESDSPPQPASIPEYSPSQPSRAARISGKVLKWSGLALAGLIGGMLIGAVSNTRIYWLMNCMGVGVLIATGVGFVAALVRLSASVFAESDIRLSELLATVFFAGSAITGLLAWTESARLNRDQRLQLSIMIIVTTFALSGAGSAWGWSMSRRSKITAGPERMKLLAVGWMLTIGFLSLLFLTLMSFVWALETGGLPDEIKPYFIGAIVTMPLMIPGTIFELRWRAATNKNQTE